MNRVIGNLCQFCDEFKTRTCHALSPPSDRFLFANEDFFVFPTLGSFVAGYLLICPAAHVPSCASLDREMLDKLQKLLGTTRAILRTHYGESVVFEHGLASCDRRAGGCVDHAHLHVVPGSIDLKGFVSQKFAAETLSEWHDLLNWRGRPYLLAENTYGPAVISEVLDNLPSQFLRRHVAHILNVEEHWDWGAYLGFEEIKHTLETLKADFQAIDF